MENIGRNRNTVVKLASQNRNAVTACSPLVPGKLFSNFLMKVHTEVCVQWDLLRKSKISGQCLHTLPRYGNNKKIRFSATLFYNQLLLLIKFYLV